MSSIPAWKRAGLSVRNKDTEGDLLVTKRIETADLTSKQIKRESNKRKLQDDAKNKKDKKPPKRIKLPKSERKPPPVKDQLIYLKQFESDRSNWKFSKSKQNWVLKNIQNIPKDYESALVLYLESIQGGSRDRLVEELRGNIERWNTKYEEMERKLLAEEGDEKQEIEIETEKETEKEAEKETKTTEVKAQNEAKEELNVESVRRFKVILETLVDEKIVVKGEEEESRDTETNRTHQQEESRDTETNRTHQQEESRDTETNRTHQQEESRDTVSHQQEESRDTVSHQQEESRDTVSHQQEESRDTVSHQQEESRDTVSHQQEESRDTVSHKQAKKKKHLNKHDQLEKGKGSKQKDTQRKTQSSKANGQSNLIINEIDVSPL
ncbi:hypothetical protein KGF56_004308 [Candida oxycetoniae]|uniref:WKF domain-containing protein n=1 Tax=Candida oxycetoniae TaxID=497107 RepID=A0AAI9STN6_9ASCO|nr:uncharacterized protein KGF56_004308 [Candida oxycetoniae]KAI3402847.2 hypothetical protein KGF56_004308 [Candida oxycetoniae]